MANIIYQGNNYNSDNMRIIQLMKELSYYTEEEYNTNTQHNKLNYEHIMESNNNITIYMKILSEINTSLRTRENVPYLCSFIEVINTYKQWIDEEKEWITYLKYPFPDIVDMSYKLYCEKKETDIMNNPKLAPLLQKIKDIKFASQNGVNPDECLI